MLGAVLDDSGAPHFFIDPHWETQVHLCCCHGVRGHSVGDRGQSVLGTSSILGNIVFLLPPSPSLPENKFFH